MALRLVRRGIGRGQATSEDLVVIHRLPAATMEPDRGVDVLGDRVGGDQTDFAQRGDPDDRAGPAPERAAPAVLAGLQDAIEEGLLVEPLRACAVGIGQRAGRASALVFEGLVVVEVLGGLDQGDPRIVEVAEGVHQEVRRRDVVGVEDTDDVGVDDPEGMVQVARLGMFVGRAREVVRTKVRCQPRDLRSVTVVEHPGLVRDAHGDCRGDGRCEHLEAFVVGRHQDRDPGRRGRDVVRGGPAADVPQREREQQEPEERMDFENEERDRDPPDVKRECPAGAPDEVPQGDREREHGDRSDGACAQPGLGRWQRGRGQSCVEPGGTTPARDGGQHTIDSYGPTEAAP